MENVLNEKKQFVVFEEIDFDFIYECVNTAKFPHQQAFIVPVLLDELDRVKNRSQKEGKKILDNMKQIDKANKVLEMSKAKK